MKITMMKLPFMYIKIRKITTMKITRAKTTLFPISLTNELVGEELVDGGEGETSDGSCCLL